jgi:ABC-type multidrug transport system ATPase subunit
MSLQVENLSSGYGKTRVLWGVNFEVKAGSITCLLGLNGAGKTTFLKTVMGLLPIQEGDIRFEEESLKFQKMLFVSRAILVSPRLMLLDEISEGVQPTSLKRILAQRPRDPRRNFKNILCRGENLGYMHLKIHNKCFISDGISIRYGPLSNALRQVHLKKCRDEVNRSISYQILCNFKVLHLNA